MHRAIVADEVGQEEIIGRYPLRFIRSSSAPLPAPKAVDFVCEADVRLAIQEKRKIHIGPKTILTPSARDLAGPSDILVLV